MKRLIVVLPIVLVAILFLQEKKKSTHKIQNSVSESSPYQVFFKLLKIDKLTDTILVRSKTRVFGCGTAVMEYNDRLKETGLDKFYKKYGNVLTDNNLLEQFGKENNTKILWVNVGNEGELRQLENEELHQNTILEKRLFTEKCYIKFSEEPISLDSVKIHTLILYPTIQTSVIKTHTVVKKENNWFIDTMTEEKRTGKDYKQTLFP